MQPFVLYCKSYSTDVNRIARLTETIEKFNTDKITFYISAPNKDIPIFKEYLHKLNVNLITDEEIISSNPAIDKDKFNSTPGRLTQQVVKSEFWRLGIAQAYLCLDSDCLFIRPFGVSDFIASENIPYTVMDEGRDLTHPTLSKGRRKILNNFLRESKEVQDIFERNGKHFNFGPNCPVWDRRVWECLDKKFLKPRNLSLLDAVLRAPIETRWYGESLIKYRPIDFLPAQQFFKMYHYAWQLKQDQKAGIGIEELTNLYCGVVYQSAWERELDWPQEGGGILSKVGRRIRKSLGRI